MNEDQVIYVMGRSPYGKMRSQGDNYYWTWSATEFWGVLVVEFGPDGRVVDAFTE